jgi:hypothetical protein
VVRILNSGFWILNSLLLATRVLAHNAVAQPDLGQLIVEQEVVARGTIVGASRVEGGVLVARLHADMVLKGELPAVEIDFASDPDHGVRYQKGERVLVFLTRADRRGRPPFVSPQVFSMKYPITSFDPTGYDMLVGRVLAAESAPDETRRLRKRKEAMLAALRSHEKSVRVYAAGQLPALTKRDGIWTEIDWRVLEAIALQPNLDDEVRHALSLLLDGRNAAAPRTPASSKGNP